jgi:hypothetical protein
MLNGCGGRRGDNEEKRSGQGRAKMHGFLRGLALFCAALPAGGALRGISRTVPSIGPIGMGSKTCKPLSQDQLEGYAQRVVRHCREDDGGSGCFLHGDG